MAKTQRKIPGFATLKQAEDDRLLEFSFKHLDIEATKFGMEACDKNYLCALLLRIRNYSNYTVAQFIDFNHKSDRNTIDPEKLHGHLADRMLNEQLLDSEAWEIKLDPDAKKPPTSLWRAHGLRIGNVFYVVWLDPEHKLFESKHPKYKQMRGK
jgi:hypothetical protein